MKELSFDQTCSQLQNQVKRAKDLVILTGAGMSTESGIPDFRSPGGLWSRYRPVTIQEFMSDHHARVRYWEYKKDTFRHIHKAVPNSGHIALAEFEKKGKLQTLITQNIDGLHQRAGNSAENIVELHGTEHDVTCLKCGQTYKRSEIQLQLDEGTEVPTCNHCQGWLKPATISFGQELSKEVLDRAYRASERCDTFLVIGTSLTVQPAASLPEIAKNHGAWLGVLNRDVTPLEYLADWVCHESAGKTLKTIKAN